MPNGSPSSILSVETLADVVLQAIKNIRPNLDPTSMLLLGPDAVDPLLECWNQLERGVCSAKLAIVRDEFSVRFPQLANATENFSFGISDRTAERYEVLLKPRNPDDVMNIAFEVVRDAFGQMKFSGIGHFASNLAQALQSYSREIELLLQPFADEFGVSGRD